MKNRMPHFTLIIFLLAVLIFAMPGCITNVGWQKQQPIVPKTEENNRQGMLTPEQKVQAIEQMLDSLPKGTFFHNVPSEMYAGQPILIEAGIAENITDQLEIQGQDRIKFRNGIRYNPLGTELRLSADSSDFSVFLIEKRIPLASKFNIWKWQVTPLKRDSHYITLIVTVRLQVSELEQDYKQDYVVYNEPIIVKGSLSYSLQQLVVKHWQRLCMGTLAFTLGIFTWFLALKPSKNPAGKPNC